MRHKFTRRMALAQMGFYFSEEPAGGEGGKGGGAGGGSKTNSPDPAAELAAARAEIAALKAAAGAPKKDPETDLADRARATREADDKKKGDQKAIEAALKFSIKAPEFLKLNESLLPKDIGDIFTQAEKENFDSAIEKDAAIKSGIVQSFFSVQANVDLLTPGLKSHLDDYLKLTKNGKQEKAQHVYDSIFEPAFEMLKRLKKAEALGKGYGGGSDAESAYKQKMMNLSRKHYLGEKST